MAIGPLLRLGGAAVAGALSKPAVKTGAKVLGTGALVGGAGAAAAGRAHFVPDVDGIEDELDGDYLGERHRQDG